MEEKYSYLGFAIVLKSFVYLQHSSFLPWFAPFDIFNSVLLFKIKPFTASH